MERAQAVSRVMDLIAKYEEKGQLFVPTNEMLGSAGVLLDMIEDKTFIKAVLSCEAYMRKEFDIFLTEGKRLDDLAREKAAFKEKVVLRMKRGGGQDVCLLMGIVDVRRMSIYQLGINVKSSDEDDAKDNRKLTRELTELYQHLGYSVRDLERNGALVAFSLVRCISSPLELAKSHGTRIEEIFEKLQEVLE